MANYYSYFDNSTAGQSTRSNIKDESATFGMDVSQDINCGIITATTLVGDGSGLTGIVGSGSGIIIKDGGSTVGTAGTINFAANLSVTPIHLGIVTVTSSGIVTANTFVGDLTGNVTGNVSGSAGSASGNAATATLATNAEGLTGAPNISVGIVTSTTGVCIPVVANAAGRNSLPQAEGSICIRTDTKEINYYINGSWERAQKHA